MGRQRAGGDRPRGARRSDRTVALGDEFWVEAFMYGETTYTGRNKKQPAMPSTETTRTARVEARIAPEALALVRRAAEIQGRSVSDFLVAAAQEAAHRTIEAAQIIRLGVEDQERFARLLLDPPPLAPAMQRALSAHAGLIRDAG